MAVQLLRAFPSVHPIVTAAAVTQLGTAPLLPWPARGEATIEVPGLGSMGNSGPLTPIPMASTAKVMVALLVLEHHPIGVGQTGPAVTVTDADVATYNQDIALDESALPVVVGEQLSEYQLLQGLLIPSASNYADMLARWDAASLDAFVVAMNARAASLGMTHTHYADASGFAPETVSVPTDLVALAAQAMSDPVFAQIVAQQSVTLPIAGTRRSTDDLLAEGLVIGIKTGHTNQAGGNFVFASQATLAEGATVRIYGAVMGQESLAAAFAATRTLVHAVLGHLHYATVLSKVDVLARYVAPWGAQTTAHPTDRVAVLYADGMMVRRQITVEPIQPPIQRDAVIGMVALEVGDQRQVISLVSASPLDGPGLRWRLTRPPG